jgi:hypothetical protein
MFVLSRELSVLIVLAWVITVAGPVGGLTGFAVGRAVNKLMTRVRRRVKLDVVLGIVGFLTGSYLSTIGFSVEEHWVNGELIYRKTTGLGDYLFLISIAGAGLLVISRYFLFLIIDSLYRPYRGGTGSLKPLVSECAAFQDPDGDEKE